MTISLLTERCLSVGWTIWRRRYRPGPALDCLLDAVVTRAPVAPAASATTARSAVQVVSPLRCKRGSEPARPDLSGLRLWYCTWQGMLYRAVF
jgi:hypothetical protein